MQHILGGAGVRASAHLPDTQRQGLAHRGLPLLAARLVQRGQPLLRRCLRLSARLGARLPHLGAAFSDHDRHGTCWVGKLVITVAELWCHMCHAATHAWHAQRSFFSLLRTRSRQNGPRRRSQAPYVHGRLRACLLASARSRASAAAWRCSAAASTSASASMRACNAWMRSLGQQSLTQL